MGRRQFLAFIAVIIALFGIRTQEPAQTPTPSDDIRFYVVIGTKNPFVFGVKNESELRGFKALRPGRYRTAEAAEAAYDIA